MKVVINKCWGGFGLSPAALLWLWDRGIKSIGTPVDKWFSGAGGERRERDLKKWHEFQRSEKDNGFMTVFSPDEKFVLYHGSIDRTLPELVECVETLGDRANGSCAKLRVVDIPDGVSYEISEYDGREHIAESHQTWG